MTVACANIQIAKIPAGHDVGKLVFVKSDWTEEAAKLPGHAVKLTDGWILLPGRSVKESELLCKPGRSFGKTDPWPTSINEPSSNTYGWPGKYAGSPVKAGGWRVTSNTGTL